MNRLTIMIVVMVLASLACLDGAGPARVIPGPVIVATRFPISETLTNAGDVGGVEIEPHVDVKLVPGEKDILLCARVIAETAENLREGATTWSRILGHLLAGEIVRVISQLDSRWWLVASGARSGYARSKFLEVVTCAEVIP